MRFKKLHRQQPGRVIEAKTLADTAETAEWAGRLRAESPLEIISTVGGPLLRLAGMLFSVWIVTTTTTITARSGSTPGSGNADLLTFNGSTLVSIGVNVPILNFSAATGGLPSGTYGVVLKICGKYWIISAECVA